MLEYSIIGPVVNESNPSCGLKEHFKKKILLRSKNELERSHNHIQNEVDEEDESAYFERDLPHRLVLKS